MTELHHHQGPMAASQTSTSSLIGARLAKKKKKKNKNKNKHKKRRIDEPSNSNSQPDLTRDGLPPNGNQESHLPEVTICISQSNSHSNMTSSITSDDTVSSTAVQTEDNCPLVHHSVKFRTIGTWTDNSLKSDSKSQVRWDPEGPIDVIWETILANRDSLFDSSPKKTSNGKNRSGSTGELVFRFMERLRSSEKSYKQKALALLKQFDELKVGNSASESMSTNAKHSVDLERLKSSLTCSICLDIMAFPQTVTCGHSFCFHCIKMWLQEKRQTSSVQKCPSCRSEMAFTPICNVALENQIDLCLEQMQRSSSQDSEAGKLKNRIKEAKDAFKADQQLWNKIWTRSAVFDEEDNVFRCPYCQHEVIDGICSYCEAELGPEDFGVGEPVSDEYYDDGTLFPHELDIDGYDEVPYDVTFQVYSPGDWGHPTQAEDWAGFDDGGWDVEADSGEEASWGVTEDWGHASAEHWAGVHNGGSDMEDEMGVEDDDDESEIQEYSRNGYHMDGFVVEDDEIEDDTQMRQFVQEPDSDCDNSSGDEHPEYAVDDTQYQQDLLGDEVSIPVTRPLDRLRLRQVIHESDSDRESPQSSNATLRPSRQNDDEDGPTVTRRARKPCIEEEEDY